MSDQCQWGGIVTLEVESVSVRIVAGKDAVDIVQILGGDEAFVRVNLVQIDQLIEMLKIAKARLGYFEKRS